MRPKTATLIFILLLLVYLAYAGFYIYNTSFVIEGDRYFILNDDAMISMRYAHNLARGYGLVWNPGGEHVEGYSNLLWVLYMALWHLLPIPLSKMSLPIQISGALCIAGSLFFIRKIAAHISQSDFVPLLAVVLVAFYEPLNNWALLGMEVSLLVLLLSAAVWLAIKSWRDEHFSWASYLLLGISTLVRMDMLAPYLVVWALMLYFDRHHRKQHALFGFGFLLLFIGSQTIFRLSYYGDWVPNTYHLKLEGIALKYRIGNGFTAFLTTFWSTGWLFCILPLTILLFKRDRYTALLLLVFLGQVAYSIYVGGDAWEHKGGANRYISVAIPLYLTLMAITLDEFMTAARTRMGNIEPHVKSLITAVLTIAFVGASLIQFNSIKGTRIVLAWWPEKSILQDILVGFNGNVDFITGNNTGWLLSTRTGFNERIDFVVANVDYVLMSNAIEKITTPDASIAVVAAGTVPYLTDRPSIDLLGKNDPVIARTETHLPNAPMARLTNFRPGHSKWDYDYSIGELKPDLIVQLWEDADQAQGYLDKYYVTVVIDGWSFAVRKDSPNILFENADEVYQ
jgi:hypothetical protein